MKELSQFIEHIRVEKRYSEHTVRAYSDDIEQFAAFFLHSENSENILSAAKMHIRQWILYLMNQHTSPRTLRRKLASLNSFYKFCIRQECVITSYSIHYTKLYEIDSGRAPYPLRERFSFHFGIGYPF